MRSILLKSFPGHVISRECEDKEVLHPLNGSFRNFEKVTIDIVGTKGLQKVVSQHCGIG